MKPKIISSLVLMFAYGGAMFGVMVALMQTRIGRPLGPTQNELTVAGVRPAVELTRGIRISLASAESALGGGQQSDGVRALDAAMRASEVTTDSLQQEGSGAALEQVHRTIMQARVAVQDNDKARAEQLVESAIKSLPQEITSSTTTPADLSQYVGATALNAEGVRVGEVQRVDGGALVLSVGGHNNLFGFLDIGGQQLRVDAKRLLFGKTKKLGNTFVSLPTEATSPNDLAASVWTDAR